MTQTNAYIFMYVCIRVYLELKINAIIVVDREGQTKVKWDYNIVFALLVKINAALMI